MKKIINFSCFTCLIVWIILLFAANQSIATTFCVANEANLIAALNEAKANGADDVIKIQQGIYNGNFVYASTESFGLTIEGGYSALCAGRVVDPTNTVLDGGENGAVLVLSSPAVASNYNVDGLTLQNGKSSHGGAGLYIPNGGLISISSTSIYNNSSPTLGGGFHISAINVNISNCNISYNNGSGGSISGGWFTMSGTTVMENHGHGEGGGGLSIINSQQISLTDNSIINNSDDGDGGGLYLNGETIELSHNDISHNVSNYRAGGGVYARADIINSINNIIEFNQAHTEGGGIKCIGKTFLSNNIISYNDSNTGGGVDLRISVGANLINNVLYGNTASQGGGGIWFSARHLTATNFTLANNTIISNNSPKGGGVAVKLETDTSSAEIFNNIIIGNGFGVGNDLYIENDANNNYFPSPVNLFNNDFDQSADGTYIQLPFPIDPSNLNNEDPLFVDPDNDDFHLTVNSPCIDAGASLISFGQTPDGNYYAQAPPSDDIDGDSRPRDNGYDIGADEYPGPEYWTDDRRRNALPMPMPNPEAAKASEENELQEDVNSGVARESEPQSITD